MKKLRKILSYILVAAIASATTFFLTQEVPSVNSMKLAQLESMIQEKFIGEVEETKLGDGAAIGMVAAMGDRWSYYLSADEYGDYLDRMDNSYVGVGITIQVTEDNTGFLILQVTAGSPAEEAGLQAGDILIAVEGQNVQGWTSDDVAVLVKGEEGTFVKMTVLRQGEEITLTVERRRVMTPVAEAQLLNGHIGYVTIFNFDSRCAEETIAAIEQMRNQGADMLLFDVRYNPGGYADELVKVLDYLLPEGDLFRTVDYAGNESVDTSDAACLEMPMAVLVNEESYSAAEFFAAALREYGVASVVGNQTVGKGYFQRTYQLLDGSAIALSVGKYFTPKGISLAEAGGITPDVTVEVNEEEAFGIYAGTLDPMKDPQVLAAIDVLEK